eukprot:scaffold15_cov152-Isochrysis_galbana.AAC.2
MDGAAHDSGICPDIVNAFIHCMGWPTTQVCLGCGGLPLLDPQAVSVGFGTGQAACSLWHALRSVTTYTVGEESGHSSHQTYRLNEHYPLHGDDAISEPASPRLN